MLRKDCFCTGVTPYLAFSVPRPPVLRVLALALAFLLPSVCKFAQQRLRGSCREREREDTITLGGLHRVTPCKDRSPFEPCCTSPLLPWLLSPPFSLPSYGAPRQIPRPTMLAGPPFPRPRLAAHERALQGIVEIIITVIALVNTSEMVMQDRSVSQSLFLEGVPVPDELSLRVLLSQPFSLLFEILCLFPIRSRQVQVPRCAVV